MRFRLTSAQRCLLAECTRGALVGWLLTDPHASQAARRMQYKAKSILGFGFSRFIEMAMTEFGTGYHPRCPDSSASFPLSIIEAAALANDVEMEMATDDQLFAAGLIAAHSPYCQPAVGDRDWRAYVATLEALGLFMDENRPDWRGDVQSKLRPFRRVVAAATVAAA